MPLAPLAGVYTALVTPFSADGSVVDWAAYEKLILAQIAAGVAGIVPCGTTGESPTLTREEKQRAISTAVRLTRGTGLVVIAGTGSNNTAESVEATAWALGAGADACLLVNPYYNRPTQAGLIAHVRAVAAVGLPVLLYNIPGRSGVAMTPATLAALADVPGVIGVKDATGALDTASEVARSAPHLVVLSGDDGLTVPFMSLGATGVVSVVSNLWPAATVALVRAAARGDFSTARALHVRMWPVIKGAFTESNPGPIKVAMAAQGAIPSPALRLPLVTMAPDAAAPWLAVAADFTRSSAQGPAI